MSTLAKNARVVVHDLMQQGYAYVLTARLGRDFHASFEPQLTPREMLRLGVFGGKYMTDCIAEFPADWFEHAKLCAERHDPALNCFGVNASQPLAEWRRKGWIYHEDPRGWFQWSLPLLHGTTLPRRHASDRALAGRHATPRAASQELHARRSHVPAATAPGAAALGLRHADGLTLRLHESAWRAL